MLSVATYNIHKAHSVWRGCHLALLKKGIDEINADILCLQEVQDINTRRDEHSQLAALQGTRYPYIAYGANAIYAHGHHGNAILSKYPIRLWRNIDVSDHRLEQRGILHAIIDHPHWGELHVLCAHFGLFKVSRQRQAQTLIQHVRQHIPAHMPLLIAGDFNDWTLHVHQLLTRALALQDAIESMHSEHTTSFTGARRLPMQLKQHLTQRVRHTFSRTDLSEQQKKVGRTFPSSAPWFKLDRLYVRGLNITNAKVHQGRAWRERSDHAPIQTYLSQG